MLFITYDNKTVTKAAGRHTVFKEVGTATNYVRVVKYIQSVVH